MSQRLARLSGAAYQLAFRLLGSHQAAEDAVQQAYLNALRHLARCPAPPQEERTWFLRVGANAAKEILRREESLKRRERAVQAEGGDSRGPAEELVRGLREALQALDERYRMPISLCYEQGLSQREAAAVLELPERTVSRLVAVGLERLRRALARAGYAALPAAVLSSLSQTAPVPPASLAAAVQKLVAAQAAVPAAPGGASLTAGAGATAKGGIAMKAIAGVIAAGTLAAAAVVTTGLGEKGGEPAASQAGGGQVILGTHSYWRCSYVWASPQVRKSSGVEPWGRRIVTPPPPAGWTAPDFDDSSWLRVPGPFHHDEGKYYRGSGYLSLICLRGRFSVQEAARAGGLTLSMTIKGGVVVYLNGKEVHRAHMPAGRIDAATLAEDYPAEAYASRDRKQHTRRVENVALPADALRRGVNVLALQIHRTAVPEGWTKGRGWERSWATAGLYGLELRAAAGPPAGAAGPPVAPNTARPKGVQVWKCDLLQAICNADYGDPHEPLGPIRIVGTRNGAFSGKVAVGSDGPIRGLRAQASALRQVGGNGAIPAEACRVRYALPDSKPDHRYTDVPHWAFRRCDVLAEEPPAEVKTANVRNPARDGAIASVWVTVRVGRDAAPGEYEGRLKLSAQGLAPVQVPVRLRVCAWRLPDPKDFTSHAGFVQSPESVAMQYNVPLWSDRHFELIAKSLERLGQVGNKSVYIPLICRTNFGNAESMVRYVRQADGSHRCDLSVMDRYLDLYEKHVGRPDAVCLYVWDVFCGSQLMVYGGPKERAPKESKPIPVTRLDPATGKGEAWNAPPFDTPEGEAFWRPVLDAVRARLRERGLRDENILLGRAGDIRPTKAVVAFFGKIAPWGAWVLHSHMAAKKLHGSPVRYLMRVYGKGPTPDPAEKRLHGWKAPNRDTIYPRQGSGVGHVGGGRPLPAFYTLPEVALLCDMRGFGSMGADFWNVLKGQRPIAGRYPETSWRSLTIGYEGNAALLAPGPAGAVSTVRFEMIREGMQEAEGRVFLERALTEAAQRTRLGAALAKRCQEALDERARWYHALSVAGHHGNPEWLCYAGSGWQARRERLYELAAEAAKALGTE